MYTLANIESRGSELWQPALWALAATILAAAIAIPLWVAFFVVSRIVVSGNSITKVGLLGTKHYSLTQIATVEKATLVGFMSKERYYFFKDANARSVFALSDPMWPGEAIESLCRQLGLPIVGSFDNSVRYSDRQRRFPPAAR